MSLSLQQASGGNFALASAALTGLSGGATTYSSSAFSFTNRGKAYAKALVSGGTTPTTDAVSGAAMTLVANQAAVFVWGINVSGTVQVLKGETAAWTDTTAGSTQLKTPAIPDSFTPFAYVVIKAGATTSGTWTFGSSNWNATGIVIDAVVNLFSLPDGPVFTG